MDSVLSGAYGNLVPVTFTFTTPSDAQLPVIGAGTSKTVQMTVTYVDGEGQERTEFVEDLISRLPNAASIPAGSETTLTLLLDDVSYVSSLTINPVQDPWFLTRVSASVDRPDGTAAIGSTAVNNWLGYGLKMDVRPEEYREDGEDVSDNRLLSFTVTGQGTQAGIPASASNGATLLVTAYAGDTVTLTPSMTVDGAPAREFVWSMGEWAEYLHTSSQDLRYARGQGTFSVPSGARAGDSYSFSVIPHADMSLAVPVTIVVADPPPAPERTDDAGLDAGAEEGAADGAGE